MQLSEYLQIALVIVGLGLITWVKMSYMRRAQTDPTINAFSPSETHMRQVAFMLIGIAIAFVFFPF